MTWIGPLFFLHIMTHMYRRWVSNRLQPQLLDTILRPIAFTVTMQKNLVQLLTYSA